MCEVPSTSGSSGGGKGAAVIAVIATGSVLAYACSPTGSSSAKPAATAPAPTAPGFPWLTVSATALATLGLAALVVAAVLAIRRRRAAARAQRAAVARRIASRRPAQRAIEAPPQSAREWLNGKTEANR